MKYPRSIVTRPVEAGGALSITEGRGLIVSAVTVASRPLVHLETGIRLEQTTLTQQSPLKGEPLWWEAVCTDQSDAFVDPLDGNKVIVLGPDEHTHTYATTLRILDGKTVVAEYVVGPYTVPAGATVIDIDLLQVTDVTSGTAVPIPESWSQIVANAEAATVDALAARELVEEGLAELEPSLADIADLKTKTTTGYLAPEKVAPLDEDELVPAANLPMQAIASDPALSATIVKGTRSEMFDDFSEHADGALATSSSGHAYTNYQNTSGAQIVVADGKAQHSLGSAATPRAGYAGINLGERVGQVSASFSVAAGSGASESLTLIVSTDTFAEPGFSDAAAHFVLNTSGWSYEYLEDSPFLTTVIAAGTFKSPLSAGVVHRVAIEFIGDRAFITLPDGSTAVAQHEKIDAYRGSHATLELYAHTGNDLRPVYVHQWGAGSEEATSPLQRNASRADIVGALAALPAGKPIAHDFLRTNTADVPLTTAQTEIFRSSSVRIPASKRIVCQVQAWIREEVPVAAVDAHLYVGVYVDGNATYGRSRLLKRGYTPANATRYWNGTAMAGTAYSVGRLWTFDIEIDLSAFGTSQSYPMVVKAWANAAGLFTFQQQGDASNADAYRRNSITVLEVPSL